MASLFGAIGIPDTDYSFINVLGQSVVYDATLQVLGDHNADIEAAMQILVQMPTWDHKVRYKLPGGGELQRVGRESQARTIKASGQWDVAFPLEEFGAAIATDRVSMAYMTVQEYNRHLMTVMKQDVNVVRKEMLRAVFNFNARPFVDENWGSLTIQPLANNDSTTYPPIIGSIDDATANNYLVSGYVASAITDVNNPIPLMVSTLEQHFGTPTGGSNIVIFINNAQTAVVQALSNFDPVPNRFVTYGLNVSLVEGAETEGTAGATINGMPLPGRVLGETDSALIVEWRWIPANYMLAVHLDAYPPLMRRIDPPTTGLPDGLALVSQDMDYPFRTADWSHRFGFGVGNRLNGVVMYFAASGPYIVPAIWNY